MAKRWTPEEDALLLKLRAEGYTAKEMVHFVKERTYAAIRARISSIATDNLSRPWSSQETERALELKSQGKSLKYIARVLDRTPRAIGSHLARYWENIASQTTLET